MPKVSQLRRHTISDKTLRVTEQLDATVHVRTPPFPSARVIGQ